jgi:hypothetical protein
MPRFVTFLWLGVRGVWCFTAERGTVAAVFYNVGDLPGTTPGLPPYIVDGDHAYGAKVYASPLAR